MVKKTNKDKLMLIINLVLVVILVSSNICFSLILAKHDSKIREINYDVIDNQTPLSEFTSETINDSKVTLRNDIMYVTKRNLARPEVKLMSDEFTLPGTDKSVTFPAYPGYRNYHDITQDYTNTLEGINYYKYMLLRQGMLSIQDCVNKSLDGSLTQDDLFKHPAIDDQYGKVKDGDNAIEKVIIIDPSYRSYHTLGLYLPPGELVSVKVEGLKEKESVSLVTFLNTSLGYASGLPSTYFQDSDELVREGKYDQIQISGQYQKLNTLLPYMSATFKFDSNKTYNIGSPFGGMMHLDITNTMSSVKLTITGAVEHPYFILGVTSKEEFETYLKDAPGVASSLDVENGILVGDDLPFRKIEDIENIALLWHSFFSVNESFTGGPYNANNLVKFDVNVPAGAAVHLGNGVSVCPISWYSGALDYNYLLNYGSWGVLHEIGHGNGASHGVIWGLNGSQEGEVRNNALIVLIYLKFLDLGTSKSGEHSEFANAYRVLNTYMNTYKNKQDYNDYEYFQALSAYANIMHSFGVEKFYELMNSYKDNQAYYENKRADFIYRCSLIYGLDFRWYFNELYKTGVSDHLFKTEHLNYLNSLKEYVPIASSYAIGIDGLQTSGRLKIPAKGEYTFNFKANTISPKEFSIEKVNAPKYGTLTLNEDDTYTYTPPQGFVKEDTFTYEVSQFNGIKHTFEVSITLDYHVSSIETYLNTGTTNLDLAITKASEIEPQISYDDVAGIKQYNDNILLKKAEFIFMAKESKEHTFYLRCDDSTRVLVSKDGVNYMQVVETNRDYPSYLAQNSFKLNLAKGELVYFRIYNVNFGGRGYVNIGLENNDKSIANLDINQVYSIDLTKQEIEELNQIKRVQNYYVSDKSGASSTLDSNKQDWQVITAPNHEGGNIYVEEQIENGVVIQSITKNKTDYLIDGDPSTYYHSIWSHANKSPLPHEYTIDTRVIQPFNYYQIATRHTGNALIKKYELYISSDGENYTLLSEGDELKYDNYVATIRFNQVNGRYLKLLVYTTSGINGDYFSIIGEIDAGILASQEQIIPSSNKAIETSGYALNQNIEELPKQTMYSDHQSSFKFSFNGDSFSIYSNKGNDFAKARVLVDGKEVGTIDLVSDTYKFKKVVYHLEGLEKSNHDVEIISDGGLFNIEFIGISEDGNLLVRNVNIKMNYGYLACFICLVILFLVTIVHLAYTLSLTLKYFNKQKKLAK